MKMIISYKLEGGLCYEVTLLDHTKIIFKILGNDPTSDDLLIKICGGEETTFRKIVIGQYRGIMLVDCPKDC